MVKSYCSDVDESQKKQKILILDDESIIRDLLGDLLEDNYCIYSSDHGMSALEILKTEEISLALVDFNMPVMNGIDFIRAAKQISSDIAYIVMSGNNDIDIAIDALHQGVWDFIQKPFRDIKLLHKVVQDALEKRTLLIENRRYKENLELMVRERTEELLQSRTRIIGILSRAAEYKDYETGQHFIRVSLYSGIIASGLKLKSDKIEMIQQAAPVHDIGKIGIPEQILLKNGKLSDVEFEAMKMHCQYGLDILNSNSLENLLNHGIISVSNITSSSDDLLETASKIAMNHHERVDGSGYPAGLTGAEIPLEAKIVAVADVYDALGSDRPYKRAWSEEKCQNFIIQKSGVLFDPDVVDAFIANIKKIIEVKYNYTDPNFKQLYMV